MSGAPHAARYMLSRMTRRTILVLSFLAVTVLLFAAMSALTAFPLLDTMWRASAGEIHRAVSALTASQVRSYRIMLLLDFVYPIAYTGLLVVLFRLPGRGPRGTVLLRRAGIGAAVVAGLSDYVENAMILTLLAARPEESAAARVLGGVTTVKWIAAGTAVAVLVVVSLGSVLRYHVLTHRRRRRTSPRSRLTRGTRRM